MVTNYWLLLHLRQYVGQYSKWLIMIMVAVGLVGCGEQDKVTKPTLLVGVTPDYPPFEFMHNNTWSGLDIDLAKLIAKQLNRSVQFKSYPYQQLFTALNQQEIDLAISAISYTNERSKQFDLSDFYYFTDIALVFHKSKPIYELAALPNYKVGVQQGTTMEDWAIARGATVIAMEVSFQLIEALKSKQVEIAILEREQAIEITKNSTELDYWGVPGSRNGYVIALKKGSGLLERVNAALANIKADGDLQQLRQQWLEIMLETELHDAS